MIISGRLDAFTRSLWRTWETSSSVRRIW